MLLLWRETPNIDVLYVYKCVDAVKWTEHRHSGTRLSEQEQKPGLKDQTYSDCGTKGTKRVTYCMDGACFLLVFFSTQIISCVVL